MLKALTFMILGTCALSARANDVLEASLTNSVAETRIASVDKLTQNRQDDISTTIRLVEAQKATQECEENSTLHVSVKLLGSLRATEARKLMLDMIDLKIKFKGGARHPLTDYYPSAFSLSQIGFDSQFAEMLKAKIGENSSVEKRRLFTWVAFKCLGPNLASSWLSSLAQTAAGREKEAFEAAIKDLPEQDKLLLMVRDALK